jgi:equilibrative nucleoside transporter 1/2/3
MERIRKLIGGDGVRDHSYEPLEGGSERPDGDDMATQKFSWTVYCVFALLGVAMLWAW